MASAYSHLPASVSTAASSRYWKSGTFIYPVAWLELFRVLPRFV